MFGAGAQRARLWIGRVVAVHHSRYRVQCRSVPRAQLSINVPVSDLVAVIQPWISAQCIAAARAHSMYLVLHLLADSKHFQSGTNYSTKGKAILPGMSEWRSQPVAVQSAKHHPSRQM